MGNLDAQLDRKKKKRKSKRRSSFDQDLEKEAKPKKRAKGERNEPEIIKKYMRFGDHYESCAMIVENEKFMKYSLGDMEELTTSNQLNEKSVTSLSMSNEGGSVTTFFTAKAQPLQYVKPPLPEIARVNVFSEFISEYKEYYIDKTTWVKDVIECKDRVQLYTTGRGMGKSLNISMLANFLSKKDKSSFKGSILRKKHKEFVQ